MQICKIDTKAAEDVNKKQKGRDYAERDIDYPRGGRLPKVGEEISLQVGQTRPNSMQESAE